MRPEPKMEHGDDWVSYLVGDIRAVAGRLQWQSGTVYGEVSVHNGERPLIEYQRVNCQSTSARRDLVTELRRWDQDQTWHEILTPLFGEAVRHYRTAGNLTDQRNRALAPAPTFLVGDFWPDMERPSLLFGDSEAAKSTISLALLVAIASGKTTIAGADPHRTGPVAFLDWEDDQLLFRWRLQRMLRSLGIDEDACAPILYHNASERGALHQIVESLQSQLENEGVVASVIDARSGAQAGSLTDDSDTNLFFNAVRYLGTRAWVIDHLDKGSTKEGRAQKHSFGSVFVRGRVVSSWFAKANHSTATQKIVTLSDAKWNHGPPRETRTLVVDWSEGVRIDRRAEVWVDPEPGTEPTGQAEQARDYVMAHPAGLTTSDIANHLGVESRHASAVLRRLADRAHIQRIDNLWLPLNDPY